MSNTVTSAQKAGVLQHLLISSQYSTISTPYTGLKGTLKSLHCVSIQISQFCFPLYLLGKWSDLHKNFSRQ